MKIDQQKISVEINTNKRIAGVSPLIFGNFIEFIQDCIDGGMWAELMVNRGFENPDQNKDGVSDPWFPSGFNDVGRYIMDEQECFNSKYSQQIEVINHYGGYRGITQKNIRLFKGEEYNGYIWLKADKIKGDIQIRLMSQSSLLFSKEILIKDRNWNQYQFSYKCETDIVDAVFEVALYGTGKLWLDQVSLMPQSAVDGVWQEVVRATQDLKPGIMRFPGGCFADCYHWEDGIGDKDNRPTRENLHWKGNEENNFGTDEYIMFCRNTGCEPLICINFGTGTPEEAANWVEYCNGPLESKYGKLRAVNGHPEPYQVKYWDIGNESFGDWEIGHCNAAEFAKKYMDFYKAMKEKDPGIQIIACGGEGNDLSQEWNRTLLKVTGGALDYIALHFYPPKIGVIPIDNELTYYGTVGSVCKYEEIVQDTVQSIQKIVADPAKVKIAVTEWNTMYNNSSFREHTLEAAIFNAGMLNMFLRNSEVIRIGNFSDLVNGWQGGCIRSNQGKVYRTASYYVLKLYANSDIQSMVESRAQSETYDIDAVGHVVNVKDVPYVDVVSGLNKDNELVVFIINRHLQRGAGIKLNIKGAQIKSGIRSSEITSANSFDINSAEQELIKITDRAIEDYDPKQELIVSPCSIRRFIIPLMK
ncbi:MAG TPA: hypothetical protein DDW65_03850 [Firmicutes bacterium]|jgi:alpha-L-arabinofuranosidase|nr:hypothetical protein [Bacillota bacterium]